MSELSLVPVSEQIRFVRHAALPGVELLRAEHSTREWKVFNSVHSLSISESWLGHVHYRGRTLEVTPGNVFCTEPGETHTTSRPASAGALRVLMIDAKPLHEQFEELGLSARSIGFSEIVTRKAASQVRQLSEVLARPDGGGALELQSAFVDLATAVAQQLLRERPARSAAKEDAPESADAMRDLLHARVELGLSASLEELAAVAKLGKFRALRAFKRRYGMPPHTYLLCLRLSRARELMKGGLPAAATAVECGFADQSHMTRHFQRYCGYPPSRYGGPTRSIVVGR